jgi:hypothetical protein
MKKGPAVRERATPWVRMASHGARRSPVFTNFGERALIRPTFRRIAGSRCSEDEFQGQLHKASWQRFRNFAEVWRTDVVVRQPEVSVVENVEELRAELRALGLANWNILECGEIPLFEAGSFDDVAAFIAELSGRGGVQQSGNRKKRLASRAARTDITPVIGGAL